MKNYSVFDMIGPQMIGPSSSHTAGAARLGGIVCRMAGGSVKSAKATLFGSFARTGRGHGTDRAVVAGLLGLAPDDPKLCRSMELAEEQGKQIMVEFSSEEAEHPNTVRILAEKENGRVIDVTGISAGGGKVEIRKINGMEVSFGCEYPTLLVFHQDRPGVIHHVTKLLAEADVNIAFMHVFRNSRHLRACMVIETDNEIPQTLVQRLPKENAEIDEVCVL